MGKFYRFSGIWVLALFGIVVWQTPAFASISATETVTATPVGANYQYAITLKNTGTTNIGTLWFGWVPFYDLLPTAPSLISSPPGWNGINAPDVFGTASAQWTTTTSPLLPGATLSGFKFNSSDSPAVIGGVSFFAGFPVTESYVYIAAPQAPGDSGFALSAPVQTPEPGSIALLLAVPAGLLIRRKRN